MKSVGLRTTIYTVDNIEIAKEWYAKAFEVQPYFYEPFYVGFDILGYELGLVPKEGNVKKGENVLSYWGVDNIQKAYDHLISLGAIGHEKPINVGGEIMVASVKDLWDNVIGIIYNPEFKIRLKKNKN